MEKLPFPISKNWSCRESFEELLEKAEFVFRDDVGEKLPIIKLREPIETMDLIYISYDSTGVVNDSEGRFNDYHGARIQDSSKDIVKFIYDFLVEEKSGLPELPSNMWMPTDKQDKP